MLIPFLKHSNVVDLAFLINVILVAGILIPVGIWIVIAARRRKPIYYFLAIALLPLMIALVGTFLRYRRDESLMSRYEPLMGARNAAEARQESRNDYLITTLIGVAGTAVPGLIGVTGLILKKERKG